MCQIFKEHVILQEKKRNDQTEQGTWFELQSRGNSRHIGLLMEKLGYRKTEKLEGAVYRSHTQYILTDRHSIWYFSQTLFINYALKRKKKVNIKDLKKGTKMGKNYIKKRVTTNLVLFMSFFIIQPTWPHEDEIKKVILKGQSKHTKKVHWGVPEARLVEQGASNNKDMGSILQKHMDW